MNFEIVDYENVSNDLYSGNWKLRAKEKGVWKNKIKQQTDDITILSDRDVICLKSSVEDFGSYEITITLEAKDDAAKNISIFTGRRNLVKKIDCIPANSFITFSFLSYVTPYIPALTYKAIYDKTVYVSILGKNTTIKDITVKKCSSKVIFIAGDSTLTDQNALTPYYPISSCAGWAQDISLFAKDIAVCNYAHSGLTTNCFRDDGHLDILKTQIKEGDYFFIQFGHNDQKRRNLLPFDGYKKNLEWYVNEIRKLKANPVIFSPISRVPVFDENETYSLLSDYTKACEEVSQSLNVPFIDLHEFTFNKWTSMPKDYVKNYFIPGDITHTNDYGALMIADFVAKKLIEKNILPDNITLQDVSCFNPECDTKDFPIEENLSSPFDIAMPFMDVNEVQDLSKCQNAFKKGLMDPCVMHIHPKDFLPRAQLLMILLRALRLPGTRPYVGSFKDISKYEWDSSFVQTCINEKLIDDTTVTLESFRPNEYLTYGEFASFCIRGLMENIEKRNVSMNDCFNMAIEKGLISNNKNISDFITREEVYIGLAQIIDLKNNVNTSLPSDTEMHPVH